MQLGKNCSRIMTKIIAQNIKLDEKGQQNPDTPKLARTRWGTSHSDNSRMLQSTEENSTPHEIGGTITF